MWRAAAVVMLTAMMAACSSVEPSAAPTTDAITTSTTPVASTGAAPSDISSSATTSPSEPPSTSVAPTPPDVVTPDGFATVAATVTTAEGQVCELCLWLADSSATRARGLMSVTDLGGADGMAFVYPSPHTGSFWMKNTVLPLSIAFFAENGAFLDAFDMEPCAADPCPQYPTPRRFVVAIETSRGDLGDLGIAPGSRLELSELPCDPTA